jgi:glutathione S-transferase
VLEGPAGPDGKRPVLTQSGAILTRLARDLGRFGGATPEEGDEILRWILWDNHKLTNFTATHRFLTNFAPEKVRNPDVIGFLDGRRRAAMKVLEGRLTQQDWVALPDRPTIADLSCCGYMFWLDQNGDSAQAYPAVSAWLDRIRALPGWQAPEALMKPAFG